jgi:trans-aconitate methyltransferase
MMKKIKDIDTALEVFKEAAKVHGEATETGNYKLGNKNYDLIVKAVAYLKELNQTAQLYQLLDNINLSVRIWAATYLLPVDEKDALKVLDEASKGKGIISLNAELTIQEWKKGHLTNL